MNESLLFVCSAVSLTRIAEICFCSSRQPCQLLLFSVGQHLWSPSGEIFSWSSVQLPDLSAVWFDHITPTSSCSSFESRSWSWSGSAFVSWHSTVTAPSCFAEGVRPSGNWSWDPLPFLFLNYDNCWIDFSFYYAYNTYNMQGCVKCFCSCFYNCIALSSTLVIMIDNNSRTDSNNTFWEHTLYYCSHFLCALWIQTLFYCILM